MPTQANASGDARPSPDALLAEAARERRGTLKVFLGAAPGVGKTYEMLKAAHALRAEGVDVVVGLVETHGRAETAALLEGLELVPRRRVAYRGQVLGEMDLDALLARRPAVALVDELAHTNAPGSRHAKRHTDVEELLAAGIDVLATLNVQHLESLNDVVARITRVRVRETLPDRVLDEADEVEVVDLTPADLVKRLNEGKVYGREQARRALRHYFTPGNLTALRELALRRTAQRVDDQMVSYMRSHAIAGPWAAGERVLVCVSDDPGAAGLVRHAKRAADRARSRFTALHVETPRGARRGEAARDRVADTLRLAEQLGGEALTIPGQDVAEEVVAFARPNNFTQLIVGKAAGRPRWREALRGSVVAELTRRADGISVHVIPREATGDGTVPAKAVATRPAAGAPDAGAYLSAAGLVALAGLAAWLVGSRLEVQNLSLFFLLAVIGSAVLHGFGPSLLASLLSLAAYNFFFLPPLYTFTIGDPSNILALLFFLVVALVTSRLTARVREQAEVARAMARATAQLSAFARKLAGIGTEDDLLWAASHQVALMLRVRVVVLLPDGEGRLSVAAGYPPDDRVPEADLAAAQWAFENGKVAGRGSPTLPGTGRLFLPLRTERAVLGVVGIDRDEPGPILTPDGRRLLDALLDQTAVALERVRLVRDIEQARLAGETERLRSAMLTSLSHDLRTPLAAIIGTATTMRDCAPALSAADRDGLLDTLLAEAERMSRFVRNLLDMTRLEAGAVAARREATDLADVVSGARRRAAAILAGHAVALDLAPDLPMVLGDHLLLEQALFNVLDNAAKYAPPGSRVTVAARRHGSMVRLSVADEGPGLPDGDAERVFDKFYRVQARDHRTAGTGLGLAICRGFMEAMGGTATARDRDDGRPGAVFELSLPADDRSAAIAREGAP